MNCDYCNLECIDHSAESTNKIVRFECQPCGATFRFLREGGLLYVTWKNVYLADRRYLIKLYDGVTGNAPTFLIYFLVKNAEYLLHWEELVRWDFIPESWTPQNVQDKLRLYLPFL